MAGKTRYLEHAVLNQVLRGVAGPTPSAVYVGLFTSPPSDLGGGTEVSASGYARSAATFAAPVNGVCNSTNIVAYSQAPVSWGTVTHWGLFDQASGGNLLYWSTLNVQRVVDAGTVLSFPAGALVVQED